MSQKTPQQTAHKTLQQAAPKSAVDESPNPSSSKPASAKPARITRQPAYAQGLYRPHRYKVLYGGRGGGKSTAVADALLLHGYAGVERILCCREVQNTVRESVHHLLAARIEALGLSGFYQVLEREIRGANGTTFLYKGLKDRADGLKSTAHITRAWVEEAQTVSEASWQTLIPTIREEGSEIWLTFNPRLRGDATSQRFVLSPPSGAYVARVNWNHNPFFPQTLADERLRDQAQRPETYAHVWEGGFDSLAAHALIPPAWVQAAVGLDLPREGPKSAGLDVGGQGRDASALALRHGPVLTGLHRWQGLDTSALTLTATAALERAGVGEGAYDSVGIGAGVTGHWATMGREGSRPAGLSWTPWNGGASVLWPDRRLDPLSRTSPRNRDQFANLKAQGWYALRARFEAAAKIKHGQGVDPGQAIALPTDTPHLSQLIDELSQPIAELSSTGKAQVNKQPEGTKSPNLADALMMAYWPLSAGAFALGVMG